MLCIWALLLFFSHSIVSNSLWPHGQQHTRLPCPSPPPGACSNSCPLSQWCHLTIWSSIVPFSSCLQSFPASGSFLMSSQLFTSGGISIGASASVLLMYIQNWFPLGLTVLIFLQSKGLLRVFSNTTVQSINSLAFSFLSFFFLHFIFIYLFIFISWRQITLQYFSGFCHTLTWISHGFTCIPHPDTSSHLPLYPNPLGLPSAPGPSTCLMHPTWAVDLFYHR